MYTCERVLSCRPYSLQLSLTADRLPASRPLSKATHAAMLAAPQPATSHLHCICYAVCRLRALGNLRWLISAHAASSHKGLTGSWHISSRKVGHDPA